MSDSTVVFVRSVLQLARRRRLRELGVPGDSQDRPSAREERGNLRDRASVMEREFNSTMLSSPCSHTTLHDYSMLDVSVL